MRNYTIALCLLLSNVVHATDYSYDEQTVIVQNDQLGVKKILTQEVEDCILFLEKYVDPNDREFIRFFTTYAVPKELREKTALTLSFVCHSLSGPGRTLGGYQPLALQREDSFIPIQKVDNSDTLWWIDIRDYNWSQQSWENVSAQDGYIVEPAVDHKEMGALRLMAGNALVRADWFIVASTDILRQADQGIENNIYKELLYSQVGKPNNVDEFREIWGLDIKKAQKFGNEFGSLVILSKQVARSNRVLYGYRTEMGWLYETYDVKDDTGDRDYLESFPRFKEGKPIVSDAGEIFASNHLHMQVYDLRDGEGNLVDFADPTVARHINDVLGDVRVKVAYSCMDCHAVGPLPAENLIKDYSSFLDLKLPKKEDQLLVDRMFMDNRFEESVAENQTLFALAMKKVNGLTPEENIKNYLEILKWYNQPLTVEQAAIECGVTPEQYVDAFNHTEEINLIGHIPGRLKLLLHPLDPVSVPRNVWENAGRDGVPGMFQQSIIYIHGLTTVTKEKIILKPVKELVLEVGAEYMTVKNSVGVYQGNDIVYEIEERDTPITLISDQVIKNSAGDEYLYIEVGDKRGLILKDSIKLQ